MKDYLVINTNVGKRMFRKEWICSIEIINVENDEYDKYDEKPEVIIVMMNGLQSETFRLFLIDKKEIENIETQMR